MTVFKTKIKYLFLVALSVILITSLSGCQKTEEKETDATTSGTEDILKNAPKDYDLAMVIEINPSFLLYVKAEDMSVVEFEPLNDDANSLADRIAAKGRSLEDTIKDIISACKDEGFLKDGSDFKIIAYDAKCSENVMNSILDSANVYSTSIASQLNIEINTKQIIEERVDFANADQNGRDNPSGSNPVPGANRSFDENGVCLKCSGSGNMPCEKCMGRGEEVCDMCGGDGWVTEECDPVCDGCRGTGVCVHCNMTGRINDNLCHYCFGNPYDCGGCHGSGICPTCQGTGWKTYYCGRCDNDGYKTCTGCVGSGVRVCDNCAGVGHN